MDPRVLASRKKDRRGTKLTMDKGKDRRAETARNLRKKKRDVKADSMVLARNPGPTRLLGRLIFHVTHALRGKRLYTKGLIETIAKVGRCPSAGGSRSPIARIMTHMGELNFCTNPVSAWAYGRSRPQSIFFSYVDEHFVMGLEGYPSEQGIYV